MHFYFDNVNEAFYGLVRYFDEEKEVLSETISRNGPVRYFDGPVTITYVHPRKRVLFDKARDANPTFHLVEAIWMIAGSNLLKPLEHFVSTFGQFSDDGQTLNGAYGYRWRGQELATSRPMTPEELKTYAPNQPASTIEGSERLDQLNILIEHLRSTPNSRRAVLQMWNVEDDLLKVGGIQTDPYSTVATGSPGGIQLPGSKDVCCNLAVHFQLRHEPYYAPIGVEDNGAIYLDMTVFNRSNDLILGALGANVVHFSFLQEYIADCLGVQVGKYHQVSNNLHVYLDSFQPEEWLRDAGHRYCYPALSNLPLVRDKSTFDKECKQIVDALSGDEVKIVPNLSEPFLANVVTPAIAAFAWHKKRDYRQALDWSLCIKVADWQQACTEWIARRQVAWEKKSSKE